MPTPSLSYEGYLLRHKTFFLQTSYSLCHFVSIFSNVSLDSCYCFPQVCVSLISLVFPSLYKSNTHSILLHTLHLLSN